MSDEQLEKKCSDLAEGILAPEQIRALIHKCWHVEQGEGAAHIALPRQFVDAPPSVVDGGLQHIRRR
jgi:hypothetical protein